MAVSLGRLLDDLAEAASRTHSTAAVRADAGTAIGQLGRALAELGRDGISSVAGDRREQQVAGLSAACTQLAVRAPATESGLARVAAAAADTVGVLAPLSTVGGRWATSVAVAETLTPLTAVVEPSLPAGPAAQWLEAVQRHSVLVQQTAALQPPTSTDAALLDRPVAGLPVSSSSDPALVVPDAVAVLLHSTARATQPPSVAEVLAYTISAETLSDAAQRLSDQRQSLGDEATAATAWRAVRTALRPYDDGTRRQQDHVPSGVAAAGRLHSALRNVDLHAGPDGERLRSAVAAGAQHLPTLASQLLYRSVRAWADSGALIAYARDLPPRDERVAAYLRGYRPGGLIRADAVDLQPVAGALHNARLLSVAVAAQVADGSRPTIDFPRRAWAANRELLERPETAAALGAATREVQRHHQLSRDQPPGRGRAR
ncbi:protein of unknown function [Modestobacter italicus]|uniref:Uncharacterized protein n=1 Tax=Modestobacter italicus (strain DSM 44449 / CECT 9708 / BC 501) TaxID=2732864 RepID=I4F0G7_MODI5|nr:hypothetical protein [Modestobacter marinus]CCH89130.1 protein of unknown function [Modestobacter marinus]